MPWRHWRRTSSRMALTSRTIPSGRGTRRLSAATSPRGICSPRSSATRGVRGLLDDAGRDPARAGEMYEREVIRIGENNQKGMEYLRDRPKTLGLLFDKNSKFRGTVNDNTIIDPDDPTPKPADIAAAFLLGTFPSTAKVFGEENWAATAPYGGREQRRSPTRFRMASTSRITPRTRSPSQWTRSAGCCRVAARARATRRDLPGAGSGPRMPRRHCATHRSLRGRRRSNRLRRGPRRSPFSGRTAMLRTSRSLLCSLTKRPSAPARSTESSRKRVWFRCGDWRSATLLAMRGKNPGDFGFPGMEPSRLGQAA